MTNKELFEIIEEIKHQEGIDLTELAKSAGVDRPYLSTLINSKEVKAIKEDAILLRKLRKRFAKYFPTNESNKTNITTNEHRDTRELIKVLKEHNDTLKNQVQSSLADLYSEIKSNRELLVALINGTTARGETMMEFLEDLTQQKRGSLVSRSDSRHLDLQAKGTQTGKKASEGRKGKV